MLMLEQRHCVSRPHCLAHRAPWSQIFCYRFRLCVQFLNAYFVKTKSSEFGGQNDAVCMQCKQLDHAERPEILPVYFFRLFTSVTTLGELSNDCKLPAFLRRENGLRGYNRFQVRHSTKASYL